MHEWIISVLSVLVDLFLLEIGKGHGVVGRLGWLGTERVLRVMSRLSLYDMLGILALVRLKLVKSISRGRLLEIVCRARRDCSTWACRVSHSLRFFVWVQDHLLVVWNW